MSLEDYLYYFAGIIECIVVYIGIVMVRCVLISFIAASVVMTFRKILCRRLVSVRGMLWSVLLIVPFLGRLKWYYESRTGIRLFWWLFAICMKKPYAIDWIYVLGVLCCFLIMVRRHRRLYHMLGEMQDMGRFWVTELTVSPFSIGLFHPRIVLHSVLYEQLSQSELEVILQHEETHIRLYHLWMLRAWELLSCMFWMNPWMWLGLKYFKQDLEQICDSACMHRGQLEPVIYGNVLLKCVSMLSWSEDSLHGYAAFAAESDYQILKTRITSLREGKRLSMKRVKVGSIILGGMVLLTLLTVYSISYPRYTWMESIGVYDSTGTKRILEDSEALREAIVVSENSVHVSREAFDSLIARQGWQEDTYVIAFGGYYKIPGIGGGVNAIFYNYEDIEGDADIDYENSEDIWMFLIRYL